MKPLSYGNHSATAVPEEYFKRVAKAGLFYSGYYSLRLSWQRMRQRGRRLIVLAYHNIRPDDTALSAGFQPNHYRVPLTASAFDLHLSVIERHFEVVSLDEGVDRLTQSGDRDEVNVAITFDDGYETFYTLAYPLLKKRGFPCTVFLATDFIETGKAFWWDELTQLIFELDASLIRSKEVSACLGEEAVADFAAVKDPGARVSYLFKVEHSLARLADSERTERMHKLGRFLYERKGVTVRPEATISWQQAHEMQTHGIRFGSHTCSHPKLEDLSLDRATEELTRSKEIIERNTAQPVTSFAYPYGQAITDYRRFEAALRHTGYRCACTMEMAVNRSEANLYLLSRGVVIPHGPRFLVHRDLMLCGLSRWKDQK